MATSTFAFSGGAAPGLAFGRNQKVRFVGTWADGDTWTLEVTSTLSGDFTLGKGRIAGETLSAPFKLRGRIYVADGENFAFSANNDVTLWEEQNTGAGIISFTSQFGAQDTPTAFASLQGRLAVLGKLSIQMWQIDADPANFALQQVLDNAGTEWPLTVKSIGDLDALYLDYSGVRSLRSKESTLNAYIDDVGTPVDRLIQADLQDNDMAGACAIVEPLTKQYWVYLNGTIYVLSRYQQSKIVAWTTFKPTVYLEIDPPIATYDGDGAVIYTGLNIGQTYTWTKGVNDVSIDTGSGILTSSGDFVAAFTTALGFGTPTLLITSTLAEHNAVFVPIKFVVKAGLVYFRDQNGKIFSYGGPNGTVYDNTTVTVELPWLDLQEASREKSAKGLDIAMTGAWIISASMNPRGSTIPVISRGSSVAENMLTDSTFDIGSFNFSGTGTHFKIKAVSSGQFGQPCKIGKIVFKYTLANMK